MLKGLSNEFDHEGLIDIGIHQFFLNFIMNPHMIKSYKNEFFEKNFGKIKIDITNTLRKMITGEGIW